MKWKIGNVEMDNQIALAPMAGVCDFRFRTIVKSMGCGLIETEMVSDKAIMYGNWKTKEMLYMTDYEHPISQQIVGSDLESLTFASKHDLMSPFPITGIFTFSLTSFIMDQSAFPEYP